MKFCSLIIIISLWYILNINVPIRDEYKIHSKHLLLSSLGDLIQLCYMVVKHGLLH